MPVPEVSGSVDQAAFIEALKKTIERHEALRSTLRKVDDINYLHVFRLKFTQHRLGLLRKLKPKTIVPLLNLR